MDADERAAERIDLAGRLARLEDAVGAVHARLDRVEDEQTRRDDLEARLARLEAVVGAVRREG